MRRQCDYCTLNEDGEVVDRGQVPNEYRVSYLPGDSDSGMFGRNSNWRGPVWMPVNFPLYLSLLRLSAYYGDSFKVECPTGCGKQLTLFQVAQIGRAHV